MNNPLPAGLISSLNELTGFQEVPFVAVHQSQEQVNAIRLNPFKDVQIEFIGSTQKIPWCENGRYLQLRPAYIADPFFHGGAYYVQEASSMFLEQAVIQSCDLDQPLRVLDLCAAPGGKSTHLISLLSQESLLVANEVIRSRANVLAENISKWGPANCIVTGNDPSDFRNLKGYFDVIVVDAPCSGSGMFRKDPTAIGEWSEEAVQLCSMRQKRILASIYPSLKEGGILIYSTCSYSREENEDISDWLANEFPVESIPVNVEKSWNIEETRSNLSSSYGYRFYPHRLMGEGFFTACFRKTGTSQALGLRTDKITRADKKSTDVLRNFITPENMQFLQVNDHFIGIYDHQEEDLRLLKTQLYIKKAGTNIGKLAGNELIPDHELAISSIVADHLPKMELSKEDALKYLRRDDIRPSEMKPGWTKICYSSLPLGWAKILPNRVNNYFPKGLRILKDFNIDR